jgi:hypothetical protein
MWAVLVVAGVGAIRGATDHVKKCSATPDSVTSAIIVAKIYAWVYLLAASALGASLAWILGRERKSDIQRQATKPGALTDDIAKPSAASDRNNR